MKKISKFILLGSFITLSLTGCGTSKKIEPFAEIYGTPDWVYYEDNYTLVLNMIDSDNTEQQEFIIEPGDNGTTFYRRTNLKTEDSRDYYYYNHHWVSYDEEFDSASISFGGSTDYVSATYTLNSFIEIMEDAYLNKLDKDTKIDINKSKDGYSIDFVSDFGVMESDSTLNFNDDLELISGKNEDYEFTTFKCTDDTVIVPQTVIDCVTEYDALK